MGDPRRSLPSLLRADGYATASFFSNPFAYFLATTASSQFFLLPEPVFVEGMVHYLWNATAPFHRPSSFGSRIEEYRDLADTWRLVSGGPTAQSVLDCPPALPCGIFGGPEMTQYVRFRAASTFKQARAMLSQLPDGFFLWIHVMTPHAPYLPDPQDRGRFLSTDVQQVSFDQDTRYRWKPYYQPGEQKLVDQSRLRYDEFVLTADRAFGAFISDLEKQGKLQNTAVIVSADHGESFEGGVYQHQTPSLTRPVIHIPLIIKTPNQQTGRTVSLPADQTALAPTIVQLAGLGKPDWMQGKSLVRWLFGNEENEEEEKDSHPLAFTQYLETNSAFEPLRHGTVGVIDDQYQFVYSLDTRKGALRPLDQAQFWNLDRTSDDPARAEEMRAAIFSRFPELRR
jgi:arylsulfatase A-like enzyme